MIKCVTIPVDFTSINDEDEIIIDMSNSSLNIVDDIYKSTLIYLRNIGIKAKLDFSKCTYETKSKYLLAWMSSDIELKSDEFAYEWIDILLQNKDVNDLSILTKEERDKFLEDNKEYLSSLYEFIDSLPLYAMSIFHEEGQPGINLDEFEVYEFDKISMCNFYQLTKFNSFNILLRRNDQPKYFKNIYENKYNEFYLSQIMNNLPYIDFMKIIFGSTEIQEDFLNQLSEILNGGNNNEGGSNDE